MEIERENDTPNDLELEAEVDEDDEGNGLDHTGVLLQRLHELKAWQKEQEMRLLKEQKEQMEQLKKMASQGAEESDDATIDQDVSSLTSYEEPLSGENGEYSEDEDER